MPLDLNDPTLVRLIETSNAEVERLQSDTQRQLLEVYQRERDNVMARILASVRPDSFTVAHLKVIKAALDDSIDRLRTKLGVIQTSAVRTGGAMGAEQGILEVGKLEAKFGSSAVSKQIAGLAGRIPHRAIAEVEKLVTLETEQLVIELGAGVQTTLQTALVQGLSSRQAVTLLADSAKAAMDGKAWKMERTLRTGLSASVNKGHNGSYLEVRDKLLPGLKRQGHERLYSGGKLFRNVSGKGGGWRYNHPFSFFLNGAVAELDEPWRVVSPQFPVMFWVRDNGAYVGNSYPAHLYERGRQIPYMEAWQGARSLEPGREERAATERERILSEAQ